MHEILNLLTGGDHRSIGRTQEVVAEVLRDPSLFGEVFYGILCDDPLISMRAADAIEKITVQRPDYLQPYKEVLITQVATRSQQEVRWHVAQLIPRLQLDQQERLRLFNIVRSYLTDPSAIVKTFSLQALTDLALQDTQFLPETVRLLKVYTEIGSPAVRSRGRKLLQRLTRANFSQKSE
jgi:hypothetical protein